MSTQFGITFAFIYGIEKRKEGFYMLVTMKEILVKAKEEGYGVPAPNAENELNVRAYIEAAESLNSPLIIGSVSTANPNMYDYGRIVTDLARQAKIPVAFNLDHSRTFEAAIMGIRSGFTSIMVDRSELPYEENVLQVKELVRIAHSVGVSVEAELGHVGRGDNYDVDGVSNYTSPKDAVRFVEETGIDALAVAIGTAHGVYSGTPKLQFELLQEIRDAVSVPLVLHGGSGTGDDNISKACKLGINKVNLSTDMKYAAVKNMGRIYPIGAPGSEKPFSFWKLLQEGFRNELLHYIKVTGSEGKAL